MVVPLSRVHQLVRATRIEEVAPFRPGVAILEAKLRRPLLRVGIVERTRLLAQLVDPTGARVVSIIAPPGYGKTTLAAEWAALNDGPVAWLTLDDLDNDPAILVTYLTAALDRIRPVDGGIAAGLVGPGERVLSIALPRLSTDLARWPDPALIVLDDAHRITDETCLDALTMLIDQLPPGFRVAIAGRSESALPLGRFRAQRELLEIGPEALAMDVGEAAELTVLAGRQLGSAQLAALVERTEGWAAGIYLATFADPLGTRAEAPDDDGRADRYIAEYLLAEVGRELDAEMTFLTRTSILEVVTPGAAGAVAEVPDTAARLARIAQRNLLVRDLGSGASYHYHNLWREYLEAELRRREPELIPELHARASNWYAGTGNVERAMEHALAAGDRERAANLLTAAALPMFYRGQITTITRALARFDTEDFEQFPPFAVIAAWMHLMSGRSQEAERMADIADRASLKGRTPDGAASFESQRAMLRAVMCRHGARDMLANASLAVAAEGSGSPWRTHAMFLLGAAHLVLGDPDQADAWLAQSVEVGRRVGSTNLAPLALRALVRVMRDDWDAAATFAEESLEEMDTRHYEGLVHAVLTYAAMARVAVHRGDLGRARDILVRAQLVRPIAQATPWLSVLALTHLARAYIAVSDVSGARQAMREAEDLVRRQPLLGSLTSELLATRKELEGALSALAGPSSLTAAELRVLLLLPTYLSFEEIGERLDITRNTVKSHAMSIYGKLQASSRGEAVERAVELGLLEPYPALRGPATKQDGR